MRQIPRISSSKLINEIVFFIVTFCILTMLSIGNASNNPNNFNYNRTNGINTKSDSMFYNDNNGGNAKHPAPFTAAVGHKLSDGIEVTATGSQYPVRLIPITMTQGMGTRKGNRIVYAVATGVKIIYTFKGNGVKEDFIFDHLSKDPLDLSFRLELDPLLEARLDKKGNVVIYGPNAALSNYIQTGDEKSAELILKARQRALKDNLLYVIPRPVIIDSKNIKYEKMAHYSLEKSILTLHAESISHLSAPVSIDPSIVVTTTADFMTGNNEGMISFDTDAVSRAAPSGGSSGNWIATTSFTTARASHATVAYNGYLYVIGGTSGTSYLNDVQYAPINVNGTIGIWTATTSFTTARNSHTSVAYNGYLYVIGGWNGSRLSDVQFAPISANGTIGSWIATTSITTGRSSHTTVAYNGYLYVIGGYGSTYFNDVQFAPINANGTVGTWTATTSFTTPRWGHTSVAYNGCLYVIGGWNGSIALNDVQFVPINANGTIGIWTVTTSFTTARWGHTTVAYDGYLYVIGGWNGGTNFSDVQYARINANGTVGIWTAATSFATTRYYHASAVYKGYLYVIGGYNGTAYFNDVQYARINANGTVGIWTATTSFATARYGHASVAYNGFLYIIGGNNGSSFNDVQYAPINANGTIGTWVATTSFSTARYGHASVAYNGYLYVIGGYDGTVYLNDVQYAQINANGTVGTWTTDPDIIFTARAFHSLVAYNRYMYVIGGENGTTRLNDVQYAYIYPVGMIGTWSYTTSFTTARWGHASVVYNGYLYVIGGSGSSANLNDVQYAPINADGTVGTWTSTTSFATARASHTSVAYNGYMYVIGGSGGPFLNDVQFAPIYANGTVGTWTAATSFTTPRNSHTSAAYNGFLYIIGGYSNAGFLNDVQYAPINANGTIDTWTATTSLTFTRTVHTSVAYNGYLYVIGGEGSSSTLNDVQFAPINADGTIGSWTATTSFPTARNEHSSVAYNGYLYVIAGGGGTGNIFDDVEYAPIYANGTVGSWTATTSLSLGRYAHASLIYNGYLYVIAGCSELGLLNDVQYAPINANGTVGSWASANSFPTERRNHTSVAYNGYLYVIGGQDIYGKELDDVQFAPINADGSIGSWTATSSLIVGRWSHTTVAYNGYLYVIGGQGRFGNALDDVQFAPTNSNGTIGIWSATASFTTARYGHASVAYKGYLYVIGGYNGAFLDDVQLATIIGPAARARYSKLLDVGSNQIIESIQFSDSGANGITNMTYAVAPSTTAVFGSCTSILNTLPGTLYTMGLNSCGRYMWVNFDLDDTFSATINNSGLNGRGDLLDFTVTYDALAGVGTSLCASKSAPNVHLSWFASPGATSYNVLRCNAATSPCTPVTIASPATNSYNDPVLSNSTNYWYLIQAVNGACVSP